MVLKVKRKFVNCVRRVTDVRVEPNMSVSPAEMMRLTENGVAVSAQSNAMFNDGVVNPSWDIPLDRQRGVDPADMWQSMMDIRKKAKEGHKRDLQLYGNVPDPKS